MWKTVDDFAAVSAMFCRIVENAVHFVDKLWITFVIFAFFLFVMPDIAAETVDICGQLSVYPHSAGQWESFSSESI